MARSEDVTDHGDETFLTRWSRRKRALEAETAAPGNRASTPEASPPPAAEPEIDPATLPRIEDLTAHSDFTVFLKRGVPELLKRQALRHAWASDPAIRDFIEVAENQYNFNAPDGVPGFGELPEGTDIAALLRQALGEAPLDKEPPSEIAASDADPERVTNPAEEKIPSIAEPPIPEGIGIATPQLSSQSLSLGPIAKRTADDASGIMGPGHVVAKHAKHDAQDDSGRSELPGQVWHSRRRHGGALPDLGEA